MNKLSIPSFYLMLRSVLIKWITVSFLLITNVLVLPGKLYALINDNNTGATVVSHTASWLATYNLFQVSGNQLYQAPSIFHYIPKLNPSAQSNLIANNRSDQVRAYRDALKAGKEKNSGEK